MLPYFGCAQETHQTAPSWLERGLVFVRGGRGDGEGGEVPFQCLGQSVRIAFYFEDLDCAIRRAGCEAAAVVIEDCIVLGRCQC
jgi:hypothetical protein